MKKYCLSSMDGEIQDMEILNAENDMKRDTITEPAALAFADGSGDPDDFYDGELSNASGKLRKRWREKMDNLKRKRSEAKAKREKRKEGRQTRKDIRTQSKAETRLKKAGAAMTTAEAQKIAAGSIANPEADKAIAEALAKSAVPDTSKSGGLSTGAKIGIGLGILVVVGAIGFAIYKNSKAKGGK